MQGDASQRHPTCSSALTIDREDLMWAADRIEAVLGGFSRLRLRRERGSSGPLRLRGRPGPGGSC